THRPSPFDGRERHKVLPNPARNDAKLSVVSSLACIALELLRARGRTTRGAHRDERIGARSNGARMRRTEPLPRRHFLGAALAEPSIAPPVPPAVLHRAIAERDRVPIALGRLAQFVLVRLDRRALHRAVRLSHEPWILP